MNSMKCPHCVSGTMHEQAYEKAVQIGRRKVLVSSLKRFACDNCAGELVNRAQMKGNNQLIAEATDRESVGEVNVAMLKSLREKYELTQKDASHLFGAGESSFGKWESGQTSLSTPAALLVRCAVDVPGVVEHLALLRSFPLGCSRVAANEPTMASAGGMTWELASTVLGSSPVFSNTRPARDASPDLVSAVILHQGHRMSSTIYAVICKSGDVGLPELDDGTEWTPANSLNSDNANQPSTVTRFNH